MSEEMVNTEKKEKKNYVAPSDNAEALQALKTIAARSFAKLKGRGLTIIESWWDKSDSRLGPAKSLYNSMVADVCNQLNREVADILECL